MEHGAPAPRPPPPLASCSGQDGWLGNPVSTNQYTNMLRGDVIDVTYGLAALHFVAPARAAMEIDMLLAAASTDMHEGEPELLGYGTYDARVCTG